MSNQQFGSVTNILLSGATTNVPVVGGPATILLWSDRHAATVVSVDSKTGVIAVQQDIATVVSGSAHDGSARYSFQPNPNGRILTFKKDRSERWVGTEKNEKGRWVLHPNGKSLRIGTKEEWHDPSF